MPWRSRSRQRSKFAHRGGASAGPTETPPHVNGCYLEASRTHELGHDRTLVSVGCWVRQTNRRGIPPGVPSAAKATPSHRK